MNQKPHRYTSLLMAVLTMAAGLMLSCSDSEQKEQQAEQALKDKASLQIAVMPTLDALPLFVADSMGYFDEQKVKVQLKFMTQIDAQEALKKQSVHGAVTELVRTERMQQRGTPLYYAAATNASWQLIANRLSRVQRVDQLGDKMMAITRYSLLDYLGNQVVDSAKPKQAVYRVQINNVNVRLMMLLNNEMDAMWLPEPQATVARMAHHPVLSSSQGRNFIPGVLAFTEQAWQNAEQRKKIEAVMKAWDKACDDINKNGLDHYADIIAQCCSVKVDVVEHLPRITYPKAQPPRQQDITLAHDVKWRD